MSKVNLKEWLKSNIYDNQGNFNPKKVCRKEWWKNSGFWQEHELLYELTSFLDKDIKIIERMDYILLGSSKQKRCYCGINISLKNTYCSNICSLTSEITKKKAKKTCLERYGVDNASKNPNIKQKKVDTFKRKTGYDYPLQNPEVQQKIKKTCLEIWG